MNAGEVIEIINAAKDVSPHGAVAPQESSRTGAEERAHHRVPHQAGDARYRRQEPDDPRRTRDLAALAH